MEIFTQSAAQTQKLGEKLAADLVSGKSTPRVLCLYGDLGGGKTTFIQGFARGLGIKRRIISPTFVMMREYKVSPPRSPFGHLGGGEATTSTPARCNTFYHVDLYRIERERDIDSLGLSEILADPANVVAIEWAEKIKNILPKKRINIHFNYLNNNGRKINISYINI